MRVKVNALLRCNRRHRGFKRAANDGGMETKEANRVVNSHGLVTPELWVLPAGDNGLEGTNEDEVSHLAFALGVE